MKIAKGQNPLEQKAIDAKVEDLKLPVDPTTREVIESRLHESNADPRDLEVQKTLALAAQAFYGIEGRSNDDL